MFADEYKWIFSKNYVLKKGKILMFLEKEIKWKEAIRMHYSQAEIDVPPKITLQPDFFFDPFFFNVIKSLKFWTNERI